MQAKPLLNIDKFSGMSDEGGVFYLDGLSVEKENGLSSLDEKYRTREVLNDQTAGYTSLSVAAMAYIYGVSGSDKAYTLMMGNDGSFFVDPAAGDIATDLGNTVPLVCAKPDVFVLPSGNFLYTASQYMGLGIRGLCKTGSSTTKIIDTDGRNFTTLGMTTSSPNNIVVNLKNGQTYTVTTISTTNSTDDTLEFTAGTANAENDEFIAFANTAFDLNDSVTIPTFSSQPRQAYWSRPIRLYGDQYVILSGNYIALLAADETTIDTTYKQLPLGYQALTMEVNGNQIIVSAYDDKGAGFLLLWDGFSDGWNEITSVDYAPFGLEPYSSGWIYFASGTVYYTDGRNVTKLAAVPDATGIGVDINCWGHNSIAQLNDDFYFAINSNNLANLNRTIRGVLVFNKNFGFSAFKCKSDDKGFTNPQCILVKSNASIASTYQPQNDLEVGTASSLCNVDVYTSETDTEFYRSVVYLLDLKQETQLSEVWLNLKQQTKKLADTQKSKVADIRVSMGDGANDIITNITTASNTATTVANANGGTSPGIVGYGIEILSGDQAGQRSFIASIADAGTASEVWTISPALDGTSASASTVRMWGVKSQEQRTVNLSDMDEPVRFLTNFKGSKLWLEVAIRGNANAFPVSIMGIQLF